MATFEPITINSQEELDAMFRDRVARAEKKFEGWTSPEDLSVKLADKDKTINDLSASLDELNKAKSTFDEQLAEKDKTIKQYEIGSVKTKIAHELGLAYEATQFLTGDDEDSIRKSAESLGGLIKSSHTQPLHNPEGGQNSGDSTDALYRKMAQDLFK